MVDRNWEIQYCLY